MSADNAKTGKGLAWCIGIGIALMVLGSFSNNDKKTTTKDGGTYYATSWCEEHKDDQWYGTKEDNEMVKRYIRECRGR